MTNISTAHPVASANAAARSWTTRALVVLALLFSGAAAAQQSSTTLPVERYRPTIDDNGLGSTEGGGIPSHLGYQTGLLLNYALNPLVLRRGDGTFVASIIAHRLAGDVQFTLGLFDYFSVGVDLPVTLLQLGGDVDAALQQAVGVSNGLVGIGMGDLRIVPKFRLLREDRHGVSLAIIPALTLPTSGGVNFRPAGPQYEYGGSYLGEGPGAFAFIPELVISKDVAGLRFAGNLAYRLRQPVRYLGALEINPEITYRAGVGYDLGAAVKKLGSFFVFAELFGATPDRHPFGLAYDTNVSAEQRRLDDVERRITNPLEWAVGMRAPVAAGVSLEGGVGRGLLAGYGSPDLRVFLGVRYGAEDHDRDGDGIDDATDACPEEPEDKDGHLDTDGCADPDNDGDGLPDGADTCPDQAEDADGFADDDGCAEPDNDGDGVLDVEDRCPLEPGDVAYAGCPAPDRDKDTVPDARDVCPDVAGAVDLSGCPDRDGDGVADDNDKCPDVAGRKETAGCPDRDGDGVIDADDRCPDQAGTLELRGCLDTDKDGIADPDDKCPSEPETVNGIDDADGCPDKGKVLVVITKERIEIKETVFFDTGKATIQKRSFGLLDQVALVLRAHPEVKKLRVEGHTDDQGGDAANLDLSKRRAASVVTYLIDRGIDAARLTSEGYGETQPIADNKTAKGRAQNRRVELRILESE